MYYLLLGIHILVCIFLIIVVLLQSGKAADLAGAFGGMGSQTAFGSARLGDAAFESDDHFGRAVHGHIPYSFDHGDAERGSQFDGAR